jgi:hypothetical protein
MSKLSTYALAIAVSLGTTAMLDNKPPRYQDQRKRGGATGG